MAESANAYAGMRLEMRIGIIIIAVFFGGLGGWALFAPLQSAALAAGELSVETNRKTIQHLEGGIVAEILVRDGDRVDAGQPLVKLDETQARAALEQLRAREGGALALEARLIAERDGLDSVVFPEALLNVPEHDKRADAVAGERSIFAARKRALEGQAAILSQRVAQYENEITGLEGLLRAQTTQLGLIREELTGQETLLKRKLAGTQRQIELKRELAEAQGSISRNMAAVARVKQNIAEERLKILELGTRQVNEAVATLRDTQTLLFDLAEQIRAASYVLDRTVVNAPLDGIVVDLRVHTIGGVVAPGEALLDIVPVNERLIVQARVAAEDIDSVHPGLTSQVVVTAFNRRNVPPLEGVVTSVSADRLTDKRTDVPYFLARIALPEEGYGADDSLALYPGMQAEVMIVTGERTPLAYMFEPLARSFGRALREE